jgi:stress response protein YsnF
VVPVRHQEIRLVHDPVPEAEQVVTDVTPAEETYEVIAYAEQVLVTTQVVPVERVRLTKRVVTEQTVVTGQIRSEQIDVDITTPPAPPTG